MYYQGIIENIFFLVYVQKQPLLFLFEFFFVSCSSAPVLRQLRHDFLHISRGRRHRAGLRLLVIRNLLLVLVRRWLLLSLRHQTGKGRVALQRSEGADGSAARSAGMLLPCLLLWRVCCRRRLLLRRNGCRRAGSGAAEQTGEVGRHAGRTRREDGGWKGLLLLVGGGGGLLLLDACQQLLEAVGVEIGDEAGEIRASTRRRGLWCDGLGRHAVRGCRWWDGWHAVLWRRHAIGCRVGRCRRRHALLFGAADELGADGHIEIVVFCRVVRT